MVCVDVGRCACGHAASTQGGDYGIGSLIGAAGSAETERLLALRLRLVGSGVSGSQDPVAGAAGC
jgi:hypothetical protein